MSTRGETRRRQILEAAEQVFGRAGYWGATTEEVARLAGVTQPALYRYFASKHDLFAAALTLRQVEMNAAFKEALSRGGSALEKIRGASCAAIDLAAKYPHMARLRLQAAAVAASDDDLRPLVRGTLDVMLGAHAALVREAIANGEIPASIDPAEVANLLTGQAFLMYLGLSLRHEGAAPERARDCIDHLLRVLLRREDLLPPGTV